MTKRDKLIERITRRPPDAKFSDVRSVLEHFGWALVRTKGSHHIFTKEGEAAMINVPVHDKRVSGDYLDRICTFLGLDDSGS